MKILVTTLSYGVLPYFPLARQINEAYCRAHGYCYDVMDVSSGTERHPNWSKVSGVRERLSRADVVMYLDADAYVIDHSKRIEAFMEEHMGDACLVAGTDRRDKSTYYSNLNANMGVFLVKNNPTVCSLMDTWWNAARDYDRRWFWTWPLEQAAFNYIVRPLFGEEVVRVIPYHYLNGRDGTYVRHLMEMSTQERMAILEKEAARLIPLPWR